MSYSLGANDDVWDLFEMTINISERKEPIEDIDILTPSPPRYLDTQKDPSVLKPDFFESIN